MRRLLITGGAGFIGSNFTRLWIKYHPEDRVVVLDALTYAGNLENLSSVADHPNYRFVMGNIHDSSLVNRIFVEEEIDSVVHFAAETHVDRSILGPRVFIETNIRGTFILLESARVNWKKNLDTKRFIQVSTVDVHGSLRPNEPAYTENSPYRPNSPYAASKAAGDHLARAYYYTFGVPAIVTHCTNNYGPYQFPEKLIPVMIINALERKPLPVYGEGQNLRDWTFVEDHCRALARILESGTAGEIYKIGSNSEQKNIDVVKAICDCIDNRLCLDGKNSTHRLITFVAGRPGDNMRYSVDTSKIRQDLGWTPQESFDIGIQKTVDWYLKNRDWWQRFRTGIYKARYKAQSS